VPRSKHQRKLSNYLLDKNLQLRYILLVTLLSALISGALGYMIYAQSRLASESIERDLQVLTVGDTSRQEFTSILAGKDQALIYEMVTLGLGLVVILSAYLVIMTHKVAGPLFKVSLYLGKMRQGRYDKVYNLRKGDQLVQFYDHFKAAHGGVVKMQRDDITRVAEVIAAAEAAGAGQHPAIAELRELLARKEKSVE
jgi:ABC-type multidrug transport system fused ATPase/permease subunit